MTEESPFCNCLFFSTGVLNRHLTRLADEAFQETGWGPSYSFILLRVNANPGIGPTELSRQLSLTPSTITRLVEKLEARGMVVREISGRKTSISPTQKSIDLNPSLTEAWHQLFKRYTELLGHHLATELNKAVFNANKSFEKEE